MDILETLQWIRRRDEVMLLRINGLFNILMILFGFWIILTCFLAVMWLKSRKEIREKDKEIAIMKNYGESYRSLVQSVRMRQHQFDNHLMALGGIYKTAGSVEELIRLQSLYCQSIKEENHYNRLLSAGSPILAGFLYSKIRMAEERGCVVEYLVNTTDGDRHIIPEYHTIEMLGILMDNAVEAVEAEDNRNLYVEILETAGRIKMTVSNTSVYISQTQILNFVKKGFSTKGEGRGLGLPFLTSLVNQYGGDLAVYNEEKDSVNWLVFSILITKEAASS